MVYNTQRACEWWRRRVSEHNLDEKVRMGESSFDGNPHWDVCVWQQQSSYCTIFSQAG